MFDLTKRTHKGLRHWVLYMLQDSPKNGAAIMDAMESMSRGWWRPSPGSVYPILDSMAQEGVIKKLDDGRYELTQTGRQDMDWPRHFRGAEPRTADEVLDQIANYISYLEDLAKGPGARSAVDAKRIKNLRDRLAKLEDERS